MAKVRVITGDNRTGYVDESQLADARSQGWRPATEEEASAAKDRREASGVAGTAAGTAEALARGASFGLSDVALRGLGADTEGMALRRDALGEAGAVAELVGAAAPALLTGGTGAVARAAAMTPAGGAARVGLAAASRAGGSRARQWATQGAIEGALQGMGDVASEDALGDRDQSAERLLIGAGRGGVMGGLLGGGMGAAGSGLASVARGGAKVSRRALDRIAGIGDDVADPAIRSAMAKGGDLGQRVQHAQLSALGGTVDDHAALTKLSALGRSKDGRQILTHAQRPGDWDGLVGERLKSTWGNASPDKALEKFGKTFAADARTKGASSAAFEAVALERRLQRLVKEGSSAERKAAATEALKLLRRGKKQAGDMASLVEKRVPNAHRWTVKTTDEIAAAMEARAGTFGADEVQELLKPLRSLTDDPLLWGGKAGHARALYAARDAERAALDALPSKARKAMEAGGLDDVGARALAKNPAQAQAVIDARTKIADALEAAGEDVAGLRKGIDDVKTALGYRGQLEEAGEAWRRLKGLEEGDVATSARTLLEGAGTLAGGFAGGLTGAFGGRLVGELLQGATRPASMLSTLARLRQTIDTVTGREAAVMQGIGRLAEGGAKAAKAAAKAGAGTARLGARVARGAASKRERPVGAAARSTRLAALDTVRRTVTALAAKPEELPDKMGPGLFELRQVAPKIADAMAMRTGLAVAFLASKAPKPFVQQFTGRSFVDPVALEKFGRYVEAVQDPIAAIEQIEAGGLAIEHVEALRAVYPATYERFREDVLELVGRRAKAAEEGTGEPLPHVARVRLGLLLGMPLDDSLRPGFAASLAQPSAPEPPPAPPSDVRTTNGTVGVDRAGQTRTTLGRLEAGDLRG